MSSYEETDDQPSLALARNLSKGLWSRIRCLCDFKEDRYDVFPQHFFFLQFRLILIPTGSQSIALQYKYSDAEELYRHVYGIDVKLYGEDHPLVAIDLTNRAKMLRAQVGLNSIFFIMFLGMKGTPQIIVAKKT